MSPDIASSSRSNSCWGKILDMLGGHTSIFRAFKHLSVSFGEESLACARIRQEEGWWIPRVSDMKTLKIRFYLAAVA